MKRLSALLAASVAFGTAVALVNPSIAAAEVRPICYPVEGGHAGATWTDTFGAPRSGHTHQGQDIMSVGAQKGRPLVSAVDGEVVEIVHENSRGNRVVIRDDEGWFYVYIHVNNDTPGTDDGQATFEQAFAAGLHEGQRVSRCDWIAYIGDSGNAEGTSPHVHFEIRMPASSDRPWAWSGAAPINPADSLRAAVDAQGRPVSGGVPQTVAPGARWVPFASAGELVERQYLDFYGRVPDTSGGQYWTNRLNSGAESPASFIGKLLVAPEFDARIAPIARLYWAYFDRIPDTEGLQHWIEETGHHGASLDDVSQAFAGSPEFTGTYGSLDDAEFVGLVYENVLGRAPDRAGERYWLEQLESGDWTRGGVMTGFSESPEYKAQLQSKVRVVLAYVAMLGRSPDAAGLDHWAAGDVDELVTGIYASDEYESRVDALRA